MRTMASGVVRLFAAVLHCFLQDMRMDLLSAEQEKELAVMVQDLLKLEDKQRELTQQLGRLPTDVEWMEAVGAGPKDDSEEEYKAAAHTFQARLKHGRTAKQVKGIVCDSSMMWVSTALGLCLLMLEYVAVVLHETQ